MTIEESYAQYTAKAKENGVTPMTLAEFKNQNGYTDENGSRVGNASEQREKYDNATANGDKAGADAAMAAAQAEQDRINETFKNPSNPNAREKLINSLEPENRAVTKPLTDKDITDQTQAAKNAASGVLTKLSNKVKSGYNNLKSEIKENSKSASKSAEDATNNVISSIEKIRAGENVTDEDISQLQNQLNEAYKNIDKPGMDEIITQGLSALSAFASLQSGGEFQPIDFSEAAKQAGDNKREFLKNSLNDTNKLLQETLRDRTKTLADEKSRIEQNQFEWSLKNIDKLQDNLNQTAANGLAQELGVSQEEADQMLGMIAYIQKDNVDTRSAEGMARYMSELGLQMDMQKMNVILKYADTLSGADINKYAEYGKATQAIATGQGAHTQFLNNMLGVVGNVGNAISSFR